MPKRSSKQPSDPNQLAQWIMERATESEPAQEELTPEQQAARILGRRGGLSGGQARAKKLSAKRRREIAQKAAKARWKDK